MQLFVCGVDSVNEVFELPCDEVSRDTETSWGGERPTRQANRRYFRLCTDLTRVKDKRLSRFTPENKHTGGTGLNTGSRLSVDEIMIVDDDRGPALIRNRLSVVTISLLYLGERICISRVQDHNV